MKLFSVLLFLTLAGCQNPVKKFVKDTKYSAYEMIGVQKRDLFQKEVVKVKDNQEHAGEAYKDALTRLQEVYKVDAGKLEKEYRSLQDSYDSAEKRTSDVHASVKQLDTVAQDLFAEWEKEIRDISSKDLRTSSNKKLDETQKKYKEFFTALKKSESKMPPVLRKLKDQVLFLKHNLNAKAIGGLKTESLKIQGDIESLIKDMNKSITEADEFIKTI